MISNFLKEINVIMYIIVIFIKNKLESFHLNKISIRYKFSKFMFPKGSNLMGGVVCGQQWYVDRIFSYRIPRIGASVDYVAYLLKLGF
jgi:hypothetical protein